MKKSSLLNGVINILIANIFNLAFSVITSFFLPKFLSVDTYAYIKTFQLYTTYVGIAHMGFIDGIYLKFGGKTAVSLNKDELVKGCSTLFWFQLIISLFMVAVSFTLHNEIILAFSMTIIPLNMVTYYKYVYQAVGEFKRYSRILNLTTVITFVSNILLLFVLKTDKYLLYIVTYVLVDYLVMLFLVINFNRFFAVKISLSLFIPSTFFENIKSGFLLMLGNFSSIMMTSMDRWFVKILMKNVNFAQYSFGVSMENFLNTAISPVTITLYNYFCKNKETDKINRIKRFVLLLATTIVAAAFPVKFILECFLQKYIHSVKVIFLLFGSQMFFILIKSIYVNLYKANGRQTVYFIKLMIVIITGFLFNVLCYRLYHAKEAFALGTLLSSVLWLILSLLDFKEIRLRLNEGIYFIMEIVLFLCCGFCFKAILGCLIYVISTFICMLIFMRNDVFEILEIIKKILYRNKERL